MNFFQRFTFLFSAPMFDADDLEGLRVNQIIAAIERMGFQVIKARRVEDAEIAVQTDAAIGCMVVDWGKKGIEGKAASLINLMRRRGLDMPIVILVRRKRYAPSDRLLVGDADDQRTLVRQFDHNPARGLCDAHP